MTANRIIHITAYWNDEHPSETFEADCLVWAEKLGDRIALNDKKFFYFFKHDETILGNHGKFTVTAYYEEGCIVPS